MNFTSWELEPFISQATVWGLGFRVQDLLPDVLDHERGPDCTVRNMTELKLIGSFGYLHPP